MQLSAIYRYPLKSARGHALDAAVVDRFGLAGDRRWMLVDQRGHFLSQRSVARMALLDAICTDGGLRLGFNGEYLEAARPDPSAERVIATIWDDHVAALLAGDAANDWLSERLGQPVRLVYYPDDALRGVDPDYAPPSQLVSFADGFPLLLLSEAALALLNSRLPTPVPMDRFRPNLVVAGTEAHAEDQWRTIRIGSTELTLVKPCSRCAVPAIDQQTGERDPHINRALAHYRRRDGVIYFGMNAIAAPGSRFAVGDTVELVP
jgi:uncharacterized protein YcbX